MPRKRKQPSSKRVPAPKTTPEKRKQPSSREFQAWCKAKEAEAEEESSSSSSEDEEQKEVLCNGLPPYQHLFYRRISGRPWEPHESEYNGNQDVKHLKINVARIQHIATRAFANCSNLEIVEFVLQPVPQNDDDKNPHSEQLKTIDKYCFFKSSLTSMNLSNLRRMRELVLHTYSDCPSLTEFHFPPNIWRMSDDFSNCPKLSTLIFPSDKNLKHFMRGRSNFQDCPKLHTIKLTCPFPAILWPRALHRLLDTRADKGFLPGAGITKSANIHSIAFNFMRLHITDLFVSNRALVLLPPTNFEVDEREWPDYYDEENYFHSDPGC